MLHDRALHHVELGAQVFCGKTHELERLYCFQKPAIFCLLIIRYTLESGL